VLLKLRLPGKVKKLNVEHRTSNIEHRVLMTLRFLHSQNRSFSIDLTGHLYDQRLDGHLKSENFDLVPLNSCIPDFQNSLTLLEVIATLPLFIKNRIIHLLLENDLNRIRLRWRPNSCARMNCYGSQFKKILSQKAKTLLIKL